MSQLTSEQLKSLYTYWAKEKTLKEYCDELLWNENKPLRTPSGEELNLSSIQKYSIGWEKIFGTGKKQSILEISDGT